MIPGVRQRSEETRRKAGRHPEKLAGADPQRQECTMIR
jgi:hypothetical protein